MRRGNWRIFQLYQEADQPPASKKCFEEKNI